MVLNELQLEIINLLDFMTDITKVKLCVWIKSFDYEYLTIVSNFFLNITFKPDSGHYIETFHYSKQKILSFF